MPQLINAARANWAATAIKAFRKACRTDMENALGDLLCNLRHWAKREGYDFDLANERAEGMFEEEEIHDADMYL